MMIRRMAGSFIWNFCENFNITLGRFAPVAFGWMVGVKGKRIDEADDFKIEERNEVK